MEEEQKPTETRPEPATASLLSKSLEFVGEVLHVLIISLAIIIPVRFFLIQPFYVKGASMEPNFYDHEYLIIDELTHRFQDPERGEVVVFRYPNDPRQYFIKRVIGLPGERVKVSGGTIMLYTKKHPEGFVYDERSYLGGIFTAGEKDVTLASDEYFLMGDNRSASLDSRIFGPVRRSYFIGRVWFRGWPPERAMMVAQPFSDVDFPQE